jgi:hypothetical protein
MQPKKPFIQPGMIYTDFGDGKGCVAVTPEEFKARGGFGNVCSECHGRHLDSETECPIKARQTEIAELVASLKDEFTHLIHPSWEGVGAHREDDMQRLFDLLEQEFGHGSA